MASRKSASSPRRAAERPKAKAAPKRAPPKRASKKRARPMAGHLRPLPDSPPLRISLRDPKDVVRPLSAYLQELRDPVTLYADARCWRVNEDPPHVLAAAPFDAVVLGKKEVYWCTPDREVRNFEQSFLLHAISDLVISRPDGWGRTLPRDAVAVVITVPRGRALMVCPKKLATALDAAVRAARATPARR